LIDGHESKIAHMDQFAPVNCFALLFVAVTLFPVQSMIS